MSIQRLPDWHQIEQPVVISLKTARHHLWATWPFIWAYLLSSF